MLFFASNLEKLRESELQTGNVILQLELHHLELFQSFTFTQFSTQSKKNLTPELQTHVQLRTYNSAFNYVHIKFK